jgi:hypothetical protein
MLDSVRHEGIVARELGLVLIGQLMVGGWWLKVRFGDAGWR